MKNFLKTLDQIIVHFMGGSLIGCFLMFIILFIFASHPSSISTFHSVLIIFTIIPLLFLGYFLIKHPRQKGLYVCGGLMLLYIYVLLDTLKIDTHGFVFMMLPMLPGFASLAWFLFQKENQEKNLDNNPEKSSKKISERKSRKKLRK